MKMFLIFLKRQEEWHVISYMSGEGVSHRFLLKLDVSAHSFLQPNCYLIAFLIMYRQGNEHLLNYKKKKKMAARHGWI